MATLTTLITVLGTLSQVADPAVEPATGRRAAERACVGICWQAPAECPSATVVEQELEAALLPHELPMPEQPLRATVARRGARWVLHLEHAGGQRQIEASDCAALKEAAVLSVLLLAEQEARTPALSPPLSSDEAGPSGVGETAMLDEPPTFNDGVPPADSGQTDEKTASGEGEGPPPDAVVSAPESHLGSPVGVASPQPVIDDPVPRGPRSAERSDSFGIGVSAILDTATFSAPAWGGRIEAAYAWRRGLQLVARGLWLPAVETNHGFGEQQLWTTSQYAAGELGVCLPLHRGSSQLFLCGGAEVGRLDVSAPELMRARSGASWFPALGAGLHLERRFGPLSVGLVMEAKIPLWRDSFTINGGAVTLHEVPAWMPRLALTVTFWDA